MRVFMTTDTVGGVWTYAVELARTLESHGCRIALATMGAPLTRAQRRQVEPLDHVRVFESSYKLEWMQDPWADVRAAGEWMLELEQEFDADIVHLNGYAHGALAWQAPALVVAHSCVLSWWQAVRHEEAPAEWERYRASTTAGLLAAVEVVAPSHAMLGALRRNYGRLPAARVIYNGRDPQSFTRESKEPFILTAGRVWDAAKNIAAVDRAAKRMDWPVRVAGECRDQSGCQTHFCNMTPLGTLDEIAMIRTLAQASIYVSPARYEPFGLSILEAAMSGCALVLGDIPSLREIWSDAAVFVDPDDERQLAARVNDLIHDDQHRRDMAHRARRHARRYTSARMGSAYAELYAALLRRASRSISAASSMGDSCVS